MNQSVERASLIYFIDDLRGKVNFDKILKDQSQKRVFISIDDFNQHRDKTQGKEYLVVIPTIIEYFNKRLHFFDIPLSIQPSLHHHLEELHSLLITEDNLLSLLHFTHREEKLQHLHHKYLAVLFKVKPPH